MINNMKYNEFSAEVQKEISKFHDELVKDGTAVSIETSMKEWFEKKFDSWLIDRFPGENIDNKRKHVRVDVELPVKICETLIDADDNVDSELVGDILNISRGGLYFMSSRDFSISSILKVVIDMSNINEELNSVEALAMVMRVEKIEDNKFGIGLMFSTVYDDAKEIIELFIFKNLSYFLYNK